LGVHEEYLQAGAEILETNTFGANRFRLARHGLAGKMAEIKAAGVRLAHEALEAAKAVAPHLPVLVMVTVDDESECLDGASPSQAAALLTEWGADAVGVNCSTGPATVLTAAEAMRAATALPLAA